LAAFVAVLAVAILGLLRGRSALKLVFDRRWATNLEPICYAAPAKSTKFMLHCTMQLADRLSQ
jgi:hypothetical protein